MASAGFIQIVTFIIAGLCQLIVTLLLAKYYDKDSLGIIISIISIINLFGFSLAEAGVCNYVIYKGDIEKRCFYNPVDDFIFIITDVFMFSFDICF